MVKFQEKKNQKPKCELVGKYPIKMKVKKSDIEDRKEFNKIKIEYKNVGEVNWTKKYTIDLKDKFK